MFTLETLKEKLLASKDNTDTPVWTVVDTLSSDSQSSISELEKSGVTLLKYHTLEGDYLVWLRLVDSIYATDGNAITMQQLVMTTVNKLPEDVFSIIKRILEYDFDSILDKLRNDTKYNFSINNDVLSVTHTTMLPFSDVDTYLQIYPYCIIAHTHTVYDVVCKYIKKFEVDDRIVNIAEDGDTE